MRRRGSLGYALAGASLLFIGAATGVAAEEADIAAAGAASRQAAESGGRYTLPRGDFTAGAAARAGERLELPRRSPTPDAELMRLKGLKGDAAADTGPADAAPLPSPQALYKECVTNVPTGSAPPDIHGAAGPTNLVVVTNRDVGVYSKSTCAIVSRVSLATFFGGFSIPATESLFDPRVLYDRLSGRCLLTAESRDSGNTDQFLYVAGSFGRPPLGGPG